MYLNHWGMSVSPFGNSTRRGSFYFSPPQEEALARLQFLVEHHKQFGVIVGEPGTGKSTLLREFQHQLTRSGAQAVRIASQGKESHEILWDIANQMGTTPGRTDSEGTLWRTIANRVQELQWVRVSSVLLLDGTPTPNSMCASLLTRLLELNPQSSTHWTILLACEAEAVSTLGPANLSRVALQVALPTWDLETTQAYLKAALSAAGCHGDALEAEAIESLHNIAGGNPREIGRLADLALIAAAGRGLDQLDAQTVGYAADELLVRG